MRKLSIFSVFCWVAFLLCPSLKASPVTTFGPSTTSNLTVTGVSNYCITFGICSGLGLQGFATGTDSNGNTYSVGSTSGTFFYDTATANLWDGGPGCSLTNCRWDGNFFLTVSGITSSNPIPTLFQTPGGGITLTLLECVASSNNVCTQTDNFIFDLQVDPIMLSALQPGQSVGLTVTGGCVTTGTSCGFGTGGQTPEPGTLLLLGCGFLGLIPLLRAGLPQAISNRPKASL